MRTPMFLAAGLMLATTGASAQRVHEDRTPYLCTLICTGSIPPSVAPTDPVVQPRSLTPRSLDDVFAAARGDTPDPIRVRPAPMPSPACTIVVIVPRPCATAP